MTASTPVLYDVPGPRAQRRILAGSTVAGTLLLVTLGLVVLRLYQQDQLTEAKWGPLLNPYHSRFAALWSGLLTALLRNITAAAAAMVLALIIGTVLAVSRITSTFWYRWFIVGGMEFFRGLPVVLAIFFAAEALPALGIDLPKLWYLVIGITVYNSVIIAEAIRSGVASLPRGQAEAASAIGLTRAQSLQFVQLPQAFRVMLPALISQLVVVFKDTSLGFIILYPEAVRFVNIAIQELGNPIPLYFTIGAVFVVINYALGKFAVYIEGTVSRARTAPTTSRKPDPILRET
jgi:glutamate transport system permease protein